MAAAGFVSAVRLRPRRLRLLADAMLRRLLPATRTAEGAVVHLNPDDPVISGALAARRQGPGGRMRSIESDTDAAGWREAPARLA